MITASPKDTAERLGLNLNGIMWCDTTLQPGLFGCAKVSPACTHCYAEEMAARIVRMGGDEPIPNGPAVRYAQGLRDGRWTGRVVAMPDLITPAFAKLPKRAGRIRRVFVTSMSDLFHEDVPFAFLDAVFAEMAARPWITFQVLTKRAERMAEYAESRRRRVVWAATHTLDEREPAWPANVWAGTTVEDQRRADERIPHLLRVPAAVRFLSVEPMLGRVDLRRYLRSFTVTCKCGRTWSSWEAEFCDGHPCPHNARSVGDCNCLVDNEQRTLKCPACGECACFKALRWEMQGRIVPEAQPSRFDWVKKGVEVRSEIQWVIVGSESDGPRPGPRETRPEWVLDLVDQCDAAGTSVFVKQMACGGRLCSLPLVRGRVRAEFPEVSRG